MTTEHPTDRARRNGATPIPDDITSEICEETNSGMPRNWPKFYDRDGELWEATSHTHDGDTVMLPGPADWEPMLRRDVLAEFGPLVTAEQYDEYNHACNARMAAEYAANNT